MEVDEDLGTFSAKESSTSSTGHSSEAYQSTVKVDEVLEDEDTNRTPKDRLLGILDQVEAHVEKLRSTASKLESDKDQLLSTLHTLKTVDALDDLDENDKEDVLKYVDRIFHRCQTVNVAVHTVRDEFQIESLHRVNCLIDCLIIGLKENPDQMRTKCLSYVSACSSSINDGQTDKCFESAVLGCALDDQKRIRQRLSGLLDYMTKEKWRNDLQPMD